jgi:RNA polymerase sigma factor (sigma-70 family)
VADLVLADIERLVVRAKGGDKRALDRVIRDCDHIVTRAVAAIADARPADREDLHQVGRIALWRALGTYDPSRSAWLGYAARAVRRAVIKAGVKERRHHHDHLVDEPEAASPTPLHHVLALEEIQEWHQEREDIAAEQRCEAEQRIARGNVTKREEIALRSQHALPVDPAAPLPWIADPVHATRCAIVAQLVLDAPMTRCWSDSASKSSRPRGRDFFSPRPSRQGAGAPRFDPRGLFAFASEET